MAGYRRLRLCAQSKASLIPPLHVGVGQEYWQSLTYLPSTARAGSDKIKARVQDGKTQAMPRAWGKSLRRLNRHRCMQGMHPPKQTKPRENDPKHGPLWEQPRVALILECEYKFGNVQSVDQRPRTLISQSGRPAAAPMRKLLPLRLW